MERKPVAIITGASGGIGEATARWFGTRGWAVVLAARSAESLDRIAGEIQARGGTALAVPTDVTRPEDRSRLVSTTIETFGRVDALVNNAGVGLSGTVETLDLEDLEYVMQLNVLAPVAMLQGVVQIMRQSTGVGQNTSMCQGTGVRRQPGVRKPVRGGRPLKGVIVNVSSIAQALPVPYVGGYGASKAALGYLSDAAAIELYRDDIAVVKVMPGLTDTGFGPHTRTSGLGASLDSLAAQADMAAMIPPERVAEEIWEAVRTGRSPATSQTPRDRLMVLAGRLTPRAASTILKLAAARYVSADGRPSDVGIRDDLRRLKLLAGGIAVAVVTLVTVVAGLLHRPE